MRYINFVFFIVCLLSSIVAQSSSVPFYITRPIVGTVFEANLVESIEWKNGLKGIVEVLLLTGNSAGTMKPIQTVCEVDGADNQCNWKVPTDLPRNATFALKFNYKKDGVPDSAYSSLFSITGTKGTIVTESFVSTIASSAVPTSSSVSSVNASSVVYSKSSNNSFLTTNITKSLAIPTSLTRMDAKLTSMQGIASGSQIASATTTPDVPNSATKSYGVSTLLLCSLALVLLL